jgi:predicted glycoside hydrolase/deacetylase ChbG (UPF0249 family)
LRLPSERLQGYMFRDISGVSRLVQLLVFNSFCSMGSWKGIRHPDNFAGFYYGGSVIDRNLETILHHLPVDGTCELMCHPGAFEENSRYTHWGYRHANELEALLKPEIALFVANNDITLISCKDLAK